MLKIHKTAQPVEREKARGKRGQERRKRRKNGRGTSFESGCSLS